MTKAATHTAEQVDALDTAYTEYLRASDTQDYPRLNVARHNLDELALAMGMRRNQRTWTFVTNVLAKAGRW